MALPALDTHIIAYSEHFGNFKRLSRRISQGVYFNSPGKYL